MTPNPNSGVASKVCDKSNGTNKNIKISPKAEKETDGLLRKKHNFPPDFILVPRQRYVGSRFFTVLFCKSPAAKVAKKKETLAPSKVPFVSNTLGFPGLVTVDCKRSRSHVDCERREKFSSNYFCQYSEEICLLILSGKPLLYESKTWKLLD